MEIVKAENSASNDSKTKIQKKFCGYLRKKRNKVGGWSKLWFVLQDHLLVSYKSKEDYYNKLVSFKDVLNLMPGTQIRPLEGFNYRFTIETTTQTIYTFHCDDYEAYRIWISKLLDCLTAPKTKITGTNSTNPLMPLVRPMCPHFSVDDLTYAHAHITTRNFDAIIGAEPNILSRKSNVEKILERNVDYLYEHSVKRQAVKKHIERMNISGENKFRHELETNRQEQQRHSKLIAQQTTELRVLQLEVNDEGQIETANTNAEVRQLDSTKPKWHKTTITQAEPVYAVVDLRNKYVQRKKRLMAMQGKRWNSYESIFPTVVEQQAPNKIEPTSNEAVYEDGDVYYCKPFDNIQRFDNSKKADEENIYEPINVGKQTASPALTLRKYMSRLTLKPFLRLNKINNKPPDHKEIKVGTAIYADVHNSMRKSSKFSTLRSRFGVHRKSMQRRIRKFYGQNYEPNPLFQYHGEEKSIVGNREKSKNTIKSADKIQVGRKIFNCEKSNTIDGLPHISRAVARISLFKK